VPPEPHELIHSAVYCGEIFHSRKLPREHSLRYSVFYFLLDLDEVEALASASRLFGWNRSAWFSFHDADHGDGDGRGLRECLRDVLAEAGIEDPAWRFQVLCMPRVLGYVFNPISVVYCYRTDGELAAMVYEVNNTFGERLSYVLPVSGDPERVQQRCKKALFVSPFFDMEGHYDFALSRPRESLDITIDYRHADEHRLHVVFRGRRQAFTASTLRSLALRYPAVAFKVIAGIHFEALKLWLKGIPLVRHINAGNRSIAIGNEK
jgi:DUF1365 family protein